MAGYVYLIGSPTFGWYKIGKSITPEVRIKDLGILLPFKLHIIGVWRAENHHETELILHDIYKDCRINGEWFEFTKSGVYDVFNKLPAELRIYPAEKLSHPLDRFSNIEQDTKNNKRVIGVRTQRLRGEFTTEERDQRRDIAISHQRMRKIIKHPYVLVCNKPYPDKKIRINIFTPYIKV